MIEARNAHGLVERDYDLDGRLTSETQKHVDMLGSLSYEYDAAGQLQTQRREMRGLTGEVCYRQTLSHEYDELGLARTLSIDTHEPIRFTHDLASRLSGIEFAPGLDHAFSYDSAGRLARQTARRAGHRETHIGYEYDVSGNLVTRNDSRLGVDRYRYDPLGRIVAHTDPGQRLRRYVYDAKGDRFSQVRATEQGREWHHPDGARWWLDAAGQLSERTHPARGVERFTWDVFGRMVGFENTANERWVYRYDALGRRIGKQAGDARAETGQRHRDEGARTWFLWDGDAMAGEVRRTALCGSEARFYVYRQDGFEPLAMQVDDGACKRIYFYQNDPNGAPVRLSGADGDIVWETHYSVAGGVEWCETRKVEQAIRLQGQYYDAESNLHYNRYRYFDPQTGIFVSQDPIGLNGGTNPYQFGSNVFGWCDPLGLKSKSGRGWLNFAKAWHDKRATDIFGEGEGRRFGKKRTYDKRSAGRDVEYKSDNFSKGPRCKESLDRMSKQIDVDSALKKDEGANPHWHFEHDPSSAPEMKKILDQLKDGEIPWTFGPNNPFN